MNEQSNRKKGKKTYLGKGSFFLLFIGENTKDHVLKARYIKTLDSYTNPGDDKHLLQFYWKFVAFPYIFNTKATIYNA